MAEWNNRTFKGETRQKKVGGVKGTRRKDCLLSQSLSGIIGQQKA